MATTLAEPELQLTSEAPETEEQVDMVLVERLPEHLRMSRGAAMLTALLALFFWRLCSRPLFHTDLWGHLSYGRWIWQHGALPTTEPFLPLAQGVSIIDTSWLAQLLGFAVYAVTGPAGLQCAMALCITGTLALIAYSLYHRTHRASMAALGIGVCLWLATQQFCVGWREMPTLIRPQVLGVLIYTWMFCRVISGAPLRRDWILIPLATCLWANLHGSFVMGPLLLVTLSVGRALDLLIRTGSWNAVWRDRRAVNWLLIAELSLVAALLNPYGMGLYAEVLTFANNLNLADLLDWEPLTLRDGQGRAIATVAALLVVLYRLSPRRVSLGEFLLLAGLGAWALWASRMLIWFSIPAAYYTALHWNAVSQRRVPKTDRVLPSRAGMWTVVAVGAAWIGFALSPIGVFAMHRKQLPLKNSVSADTPLGAVEYLLKQKEPLRGQMFNSYEWGDYLLWAGPKNLQLFVNSHVHVIPREVWQHYLNISRIGPNWDDQLDRYGVNYVVIDHRVLTGLSNQLKGDDRWRLGYQDGIASVFIRKKLL